jgi:signal transduction histidine kinase
LAPAVLIVSILFQFLASAVAVALVRVTGRKWAWLLIAAAILLMAVRRTVTLMRYLEGDVQKLDLTAESIALVISILMMTGLMLIYPVFNGMRRGYDILAEQAGQIEAAAKEERDLIERLEEENARRVTAEENLQGHIANLEDMLKERSRVIEFEQRGRMEAEKMAALGEMAAGVAHEINNPLAAIKNSFYLIKGLVPPENPKSRFVGIIEKEIDRMSDVVEQMYNIYRPSKQAPEWLDINEMIENILILTRGKMARRNIQFDDQRDTGLPRLFLPVSPVMQVINNPLTNAIQAIDPAKGGVIRVRSGRRDRYVTVEIEDTGAGIAPDMLPRLFEPFATTKRGKSADDSGMGLGLPLTLRLIESLGGKLNIESEPEKGTVARLFFPLPDGARAAASGLTS